MADDLELQIDFSDFTLAEADGVFDKVSQIMESEFPFSKNWMLQSNITISSRYGLGEMVVNFYGEGKILITHYNPSIGDVFYNPDVQGFSMWAQENGWKIPQPNSDLCRSHKEFWKHFWETLVVDCEYFDKVYGKREGIEEIEEIEDDH
tara:strand:+ start:37706 stop:38152 length:447 start_codon:yes stop_codon:yes gene_type:complete